MKKYKGLALAVILSGSALLSNCRIESHCGRAVRRYSENSQPLKQNNPVYQSTIENSDNSYSVCKDKTGCYN